LYFDKLSLLHFRRAKEKRLKKDAGRSRWSQYFRTMKGSISPRNDKDDLKVDLDSNFSHSHGKFMGNKFKVIFFQLFILLCLDLESNDSYGTSTLTIDQEHSSPLPGSHHHKFLPGNSSPSSHQYMSSPTQHVTTFTADNGYITVGKL